MNKIFGLLSAATAVIASSAAFGLSFTNASNNTYYIVQTDQYCEGCVKKTLKPGNSLQHSYLDGLINCTTAPNNCLTFYIFQQGGEYPFCNIVIPANQDVTINGINAGKCNVTYSQSNQCEYIDPVPACGDYKK